MTLMSLIVAVAFSGVSVGLESWRRGSNALEKMDRRSAVERLVKRQLALAHPQQFQRDGQTYILFQGSSRRLEFVSDYSLMDGPGDHRVIEYVVDGGRFLYRETPLFVSRGEIRGNPDRSVGAFSKVAFRFVGSRKEGPNVWFDEWHEDMGIPVAVEIRIDDDVLMVPMVNRR